MFSGWTSYFFPGTGSSPQTEEYVDNTLEIKEMDLDSDDWVMVTNVAGTNQQLPCLDNLDSSSDEPNNDIKSNKDGNDIEEEVLWENMLIEHPSMSVYLHPLNSVEEMNKPTLPTDEKEKRMGNKRVKQSKKQQKSKKDEKQVLDSCDKKPVVFETNKTQKSVIFEGKEMVKKMAMESRRFSKNIKQATTTLTFTKRSNRMGYLHNSRVNNNRKCCRFISMTSTNKRCC